MVHMIINTNFCYKSLAHSDKHIVIKNFLLYYGKKSGNLHECTFYTKYKFFIFWYLQIFS